MVIIWHYRSSVVNKTMEKITAEDVENILLKLIQAHLENSGTLADYDRAHYSK